MDTIEPKGTTEPRPDAAPKREAKPRVKLIGRDGNAFAILGACQQAARKAGWPKERVAAVLKEMTAGDYNDLLAKAMEHFDVR